MVTCPSVAVRYPGMAGPVGAHIRARLDGSKLGVRVPRACAGKILPPRAA